jgi:hypothetical protein
MATPSQIERIRQQRASLTNSANQLVQVQNIPSNLIQNAIPDNLKLKGQAAIGKRVLDLGQKAITLVLPKLQSLATEFNLSEFNTAEGGGLDPNTLKERFCPTTERLNQLLETRNNIVEILTRLNSQFNVINQSLTGLSTATNILNTTLNVVSGVESAVIISTATGLLPAPVLGPAVSSLDLIQKQIRIFKPKIDKAQTTLSAVNIPLTITVNVFTQIINLLGQFDKLITLCNPNLTLLDTPTLPIETTTPDNTYQGFTFQIETIPFSSTVNRRKALALNQFGIPVLESELSFTSNDQTLINELKFIIDRDNLKAY